MKKGLFVIFICIIIAACSLQNFAPAEIALPTMQQKVPGITMQRAKEGFEIYSGKCAACHRLYDPAKFSFDEWNPILLKMIPKARIDSIDQRNLLIDYVHAASK